MLHNIKHNKVLHQRNILVTVVIEDVPFVAPEERITTETLAEHFFRIKIFYGFKDEMNVPKALMQAYEQLGLEYDLMHISFLFLAIVLFIRWAMVCLHGEKTVYLYAA